AWVKSFSFTSSFWRAVSHSSRETIGGVFMILLHLSLLFVTSHIAGMNPGTDDGATTIRLPRPIIASASGTSTTAFAGSTFWASMRTPTTDIQVTIMTPSAACTRLNPLLDPPQQSHHPT